MVTLNTWTRALLEQWLEKFAIGKKLVAEFEQSTTDAVHSIRRFVDPNHKVYETAQTYTRKLVVRSGEIGSDGATITWSPWKTIHDPNELPPSTLL